MKLNLSLFLVKEVFDVFPLIFLAHQKNQLGKKVLDFFYLSPPQFTNYTKEPKQLLLKSLLSWLVTLL